MGAFCYKEGETYRKTMAKRLDHMEFVLDSDAEVANLPSNTEAKEVDGEVIGPCAPGSIATVPSTSTIYMMDNTGAWYAM